MSASIPVANAARVPQLACVRSVRHMTRTLLSVKYKMIRSKRKSEIETAINNSVAPTRSKSSNDLLLRIGKGYAKLHARGKTTPAGRFSLPKPTLNLKRMTLWVTWCNVGLPSS